MRWIPTAVPVLTVMAALQPVSAAAPAPDIRQFAASDIRTLTMDSHVVQENRSELEKIGGDFAQAYRFHKISIAYEQPGKLQFATTVAGARITYTINGDKRYTAVPTFHVHKVENIAGAPGKKQSLLDCGLLPPEVLDDFDGVYQRNEGTQVVYRLQPRLKSERFFEQVWIDADTHIVSKRERYNQDGKLMSWYRYLGATQILPRVFVPTRVEVYNAENKLAGITAYTNIKVNGRVDSGRFNF